MLEEDALFRFGPSDVVRKSIDLNLLTVGNSGEEIEERSDY